MTGNKRNDTMALRLVVGDQSSPGFDALKKTRSNMLTRADITNVVHREAGLPKTAKSFTVVQILERMAVAIENVENVKISGFGSCIICKKVPRIGRNPIIDVEATISERRALTFDRVRFCAIKSNEAP